MLPQMEFVDERTWSVESMAPHQRSGPRKKNGKRSMDDAAMVQLLTERIAAETPAPGTNPLADRMSSDTQPLRRFDQVHAPSASQAPPHPVFTPPPPAAPRRGAALKPHRLGVR